MNELDKNCILCIFLFLDLRSVCQLSLINKKFNSISNNELIWKNLSERCLGEREMGEYKSWRELFIDNMGIDKWDPMIEKFELSNNNRSIKGTPGFIQTFPCKQRVLVRGTKSPVNAETFCKRKWMIRLEEFNYMGLGFIQEDKKNFDRKGINIFNQELSLMRGTSFLYHDGTYLMDGQYQIACKIQRFNKGDVITITLDPSQRNFSVLISKNGGNSLDEHLLHLPKLEEDTFFCFAVISDYSTVVSLVKNKDEAFERKSCSIF